MSKMYDIIKAGNIQQAYDEVEQTAVSAKMEILGKRLVNKISVCGTHLEELKTVEFVSFLTFKKLNARKENRTVFEDWVMKIQEVKRVNDCYIIYTSDSKMVLPFYRPAESIYELYRNKNTRVRTANIDKNSGHYRILVDRKTSLSSLIYERLVYIAHAIYTDSVPDSLRGVHCNMKDCTGSEYTARELGLTMNYHPDNLEWVFKCEHGAHYDTCMKAFTFTGKAWRISALDRSLYELVQNGSVDEIKQYLEWFCDVA